MNDYMTLMEIGVFKILVDNGVAEDFVKAMRMRAETIMRNIPATPPENRPLAEGQILFCYELVDGAEAAIKAKEAEAKAKSDGDNPDENPYT